MNWSHFWTKAALAILGAVLAYIAALLKDARDRIGTLETDLLKSRDKAYIQIWKLTGALNLFGPPHPINCTTLSQQFTDWYFSKGQMLTEDAKSRYFLVQELLNLYLLRNIMPTRPSDELLFAGEKRTIATLRDRRSKRLDIPDRGDQGTYSVKELETYFASFKQSPSAGSEERSEDAWLLLQFVMSSFRSEATNELGSRADVRSRKRTKR